MKTRLGVAGIIAGILLASGAVAGPAPTVVAVESGRLQGEVQDGVLAFKGIPFAAPPVGDLRWRPPSPPAKWTGVRMADRFGHECVQKPWGEQVTHPLAAGMSEDCLFLNVWRPTGARDDKLPVMVWIHGGGWVNGASSNAIMSGAAFARQGLVFVSINYRLGRLGYFAFPALTREHPGELVGDYGYMDQIAALKWVRRNIGAFGGDARRVTVFGESAGGGSVNVLMISPLARGLFNRAIIESGGGREPLEGRSELNRDLPGAPSAETIGVNFARSRGIEGAGPQALARLRALSAEAVEGDLNMASESALEYGPGPITYAGPIIDGRLVPGPEQVSYLAGREARVPLMIGANSDDLGFQSATTMTDLFAPFGARAALAQALYDPERSGDVGAVGDRLGADIAMVEPARFVAATLAAQGLPTYEYRFSYVTASKRDRWTAGAPHFAEVPYVFDTLAAAYAGGLTPQDETMARAINAYWVNFAKTGDPNGPGLPLWPRYSPRQDVLMDFAADGVPTARKDAWKARLDLVSATAPPLR
ncbi:MAG TPA: carboxylesterase family protein [Phenylobacterium sp.]|nr:carboxylesterase family protein [Phenylobacterium sp.]